MTAPNGYPVARGPRRVTCPTCLDTFVWDESELLEYSVKEGQYTAARLPDRGNAVKFLDARSRCYVRCPNPSKDASNHHLPATYADYADPLVIALVGRPRSGKTHLLVAMVRELLGGMAGGYGITAKVVDNRLHAAFKKNLLDPFEGGRALPGTKNALANYVAWVLVEVGGVRRPLVFFDVAGEDFQGVSDERSTRFLLNTGALLFAEDTAHVILESAEERDLSVDPSLANPHGVSATNEFIAYAVDRLRILGGKERDLPAAVVLTKSDRLGYLPPVDRWIRRDTRGLLSARHFLDESRDVFALLHRAGAHTVAGLYREFNRCTLHFASATGGAIAGDKDIYPGGVRPMRVLQPLIALLAMAGVITGAEADQVGR